MTLPPTTMPDDNPRPQKRVKLELSPLIPSSSLSSLTSIGSSSQPSSSQPRPDLKPLPAPILLVSLPYLLAHPPTHKYYVPSLYLSLCALRRSLAFPSLSPELECRAWTGLAEVGMRVVAGGLHENEDLPWARGIETEIDKAIGKVAIVAQKHPSLRAYRHHATLLQVQFAHWQHKIKFARTQIRNLISSFQPTDPPHIVYAAHLAAVSLFTTLRPPPLRSDLAVHSASSTGPTSSASSHSPQDIQAALSTIQDMEALSLAHGHTRVTLYTRILCLRILLAAGHWQDVAGAVQRAETALGLSYEPVTTPRPRAPNGQDVPPPHRNEECFIFFDDPLEAAMALHTLMMSITYFTHVGSAADVTPRLSHLHAMLDSGVLEKFPQGIIEVGLPEGPPLTVQVTHPRILFLLTFLLSSVAKRDVVGRKPKRKVFAVEGLAAWEREVTGELHLAPWASLGDVGEVEQRLARMKADLLCEVVAVSILRSEFDTAEENLAALIAHTRTYLIFPLFAARITLHQAHLAHALSQGTRALECYRVAAALAEENSFVAIAARVGEMVLRIGLHAKRGGESEDSAGVDTKEAMLVAQSCRGMGGTLEAVGQVLEALLSPEILKSKQHLKHSLELATRSQDNHLRAVILALISAHYFHTAGDHAVTMLQTCEQLAAGLGAPPMKGTSATTPAALGNAQLGLWVGEKFLELYKRAGKDQRAQKQAVANQRLEEAVRALAARGVAICDGRRE